MSNPLASRTVCSAIDVTELRAVTSFNKAPGLQRRGIARKRVGCNLEVLIISQLSIKMDKTLHSQNIMCEREPVR